MSCSSFADIFKLWYLYLYSSLLFHKKQNVLVPQLNQIFEDLAEYVLIIAFSSFFKRECVIQRKTTSFILQEKATAQFHNINFDKYSWNRNLLGPKKEIAHIQMNSFSLFVINLFSCRLIF